MVSKLQALEQRFFEDGDVIESEFHVRHKGNIHFRKLKRSEL